MCHLRVWDHWELRPEDEDHHHSTEHIAGQTYVCPAVWQADTATGTGMLSSSPSFVCYRATNCTVLLVVTTDFKGYFQDN